MVKPIQVVVTGASGFVAKNLRKYLSENDVNRYRDDPVHEAIPEEVIACAEKFAILDFIID